MGRERALVWGVSGLAVLAVFLIGGAPPLVQVVLSGLVLLATIAFVRVRGRHGVPVVPFALPAAIAVAYTLVQLVPLPAALVRLLSPLALELRTESLGAEPAFLPLTLDAAATVLALVRGMACLGVLLVVATLARPLPRAHRALLPIALVGAALALLIIVQRLVGAQSILGLYQPPITGTGFFGTLINGNHAASVFTLSALISIGLALELKDGRRLVLIAAAVLSAGALLFTASRGGAIGMAVGGALFVAIRTSRRLGAARGILAAIVLAALAAGGTLWLADGLRSRLVPGSATEIWSNPKVRGWRDGMVLAGHYPWTGVGRGAFEAPASTYRPQDEGVRLIFPENLVVQITAEWGIPMAAALLLLSLTAGLRLARRFGRLEAGTLAAGCAVLAVVIHELTDFGLELPGVALPTVVALAVVIARLHDKKGEPAEEPLPRFPRVAVALAIAGWTVLLSGGVWAARHTLDADADRIAAQLKTNPTEAQAEIARAIARHPASDHFELVAADQALRRRQGPLAMRHLNRALRRHPANWQAHRLAARTLASLGYRSQAALEYRLETEAGVTPSYEELIAVVGPDIVLAVRQTPNELLALARTLAAHGQAAIADKACLRALEVGDNAARIHLERLKVATLAGDKTLMTAAARAALATSLDPEGYAAAGAALLAAGDADAAERAIAAGMTAHRADAGLVMAAARMRLDRDDPAGARAILRKAPDDAMTLADRKALEELMAQIADRTGDVDGAFMARARARILARKLRGGDLTTRAPER